MTPPPPKEKKSVVKVAWPKNIVSKMENGSIVNTINPPKEAHISVANRWDPERSLKPGCHHGDSNGAQPTVWIRGVTSLGKMLGIRKIRGLNLHLRFGRVSLMLVVSNPSITKS